MKKKSVWTSILEYALLIKETINEDAAYEIIEEAFDENHIRIEEAFYCLNKIDNVI